MKGGWEWGAAGVGGDNNNIYTMVLPSSDNRADFSVPRAKMISSLHVSLDLYRRAGVVTHRGH